MFNTNAKLAETAAIVAVLMPQNVANVEKFTGVVDMSSFLQAMAIVQLGDMAAETVDAKLYACDSDGTNAVPVVSAIQLVANAANNDGKQILLSARAEALLASGKRYLKVGLVTGGATGGAAAIVVLAQQRQAAAADVDLASVLQIAG